MRLDLRRNLPLKAFSVILSFLCWILVTGESQKIKDLQVPLEYERIPAGMEIAGGVPDRVTIRIQAPEPILQRITADQVDASVDLSNLLPGEQYVPLSPDRFHVPGATVLRVDPGVVPIRLVRQERREVPVVPRIEGKPPEGYEVVDYRVDPPAVVVVGPEDAVREVRRATTGSIPVGDLTSDREVRVRPVPDAPAESCVRLERPETTVRIRIGVREKAARRIFRDVPVRIRGGGPAARLRPETVDVRLRGPSSILDSLDRGNVLVEVDLAGISPRDRDARVAPRVSLSGLAPDRAAQIEAAPSTRSIAVTLAPDGTERR